MPSGTNDGDYLSINLTTGQKERTRAIQTSAGAADANKIPRLNSLGQVDETMLPNQEVYEKQASEALAAGAIVHVRSDGQIENADATTSGKEAMGFVKTAIGATSTGKYYGEGIVGGFVGLTQGAKYFLSKTAGGITNDVSSFTDGNVVQEVGRAISQTELQFEPKTAILL
jgi:hypothetical protein